MVGGEFEEDQNLVHPETLVLILRQPRSSCRYPDATGLLSLTDR